MRKRIDPLSTIPKRKRKPGDDLAEDLTDMFECIVDHTDAEETTPYNFLPAQVAAYIKPPAFRPADIGKKTENLAYVHADIRRPPEPIRSAQLTQEQEEEEDWAASIGPGSEEEVRGVMRRELQALCEENHQDSDDDDGDKSTRVPFRSVGGVDTPVDPYVVVPGGKKVHKAALCAQFNRCMEMGVPLSSDRLLSVRGVPVRSFFGFNFGFGFFGFNFGFGSSKPYWPKEDTWPLARRASGGREFRANFATSRKCLVLLQCILKLNTLVITENSVRFPSLSWQTVHTIPQFLVISPFGRTSKPCVFTPLCNATSSSTFVHLFLK